MPLLGLGTFLAEKGEVGQSVKTALNLGYRHIDCAEAYMNQKEVGEAFKEVFSEGKIKREDVFITSKLRPTRANPDMIDEQINTTLADLQLSYLDLYLLHQPVVVTFDANNKLIRASGISIQQVWRKLETLVDAGKVKAIGISNFPSVLVNDLLNYARIKPAINQIERTPYLTQKKHIDFCRSQGIEITAYGALGAPGGPGGSKIDQITPLLSNPVVVELAQKKGKTPAQILIRYHIDGKVVVIPKSVKPHRLAENLNVFDFQLTPEEINSLDALNRNFRYFDQFFHGVPTFT
jgi:aldehyde reductase